MIFFTPAYFVCEKLDSEFFSGFDSRIDSGGRI